MKPRDKHPDDAQPLLPRRQRQEPVADARQGATADGQPFPWHATAGLGLLTFNSGMAAYRSCGNPEAVAFVAFSYLDLLALFLCLRRYESAEPGSRLGERLKVAVWLLTAALTLLFSFKVAAVMPPFLAVVVWLMAFATVAGGFYAFFCYNRKQ